jgi:N6-adenosine-specific RNA methylase IME4
MMASQRCRGAAPSERDPREDEQLGPRLELVNSSPSGSAQEIGGLIHGVDAVTAIDSAGARRKWAARITEAWRPSVLANFETGRLLIEAKASMPHGDFLNMIERDLPFGARTAQMLMKIGSDQRLANAKYVSCLPPHWGTLYELTKLPDDRLTAMLATGEIHPEMQRRQLTSATKRERRARLEAKLGAFQAALPAKRFGVVYADPPWRWEAYSRVTGMDGAAENHYPTLTVEEIKALDAASIAAPDSVLWLWATSPLLPQALEVMAAWGFAYKSSFAWAKDRIGMGYWNRNQHELLLVGTGGDIPAPTPGTQSSSLISAPVREHSRKPDEAYEIIQGYFPTLPKISVDFR